MVINNTNNRVNIRPVNAPTFIYVSPHKLVVGEKDKPKSHRAMNVEVAAKFD